MDTLQNRTYCPAISIFHLYFTQIWQITVAKLRMPMPFPITGSVGTGAKDKHRKYGATIRNGFPYTGLRCRSKYFLNLRNFQIWRPAATDPHKVRPCIYRGWLPWQYRNRLRRFSPCIHKSFGVLARSMDPLQNRTFYPAISIFHLIFPPKCRQTSVAKRCILMPSHFTEWVGTCT